MYRKQPMHTKNHLVLIIKQCYFEGSIERAKSITQGGAKNAIADLSLMGIVTVIDSLCIVRQFVFEEKQITMETLCNALCNNWNGFEELKNKIHSSGAFFGNNDDISNDCSARFAQSITSFFDILCITLNYF